MALTPTETGTYYIAAAGSGASTGTYALSVAPDGYDDDYESNVSTSGGVAIGGFAHGEIEVANDEDWFAAKLTAGVSYRVDLEGQSTDVGTLPDPFIAGVHGPSGYHGGTVDGNSGEGRNAAVALTATETGTYYIAATGSGASTGTYRLSVAEYSDDHPDNWSTTGTVAVDGLAHGEIEEPGDEDWFAVELSAGVSYRVDLEGQSTDVGTLPDPFIAGVHGPSGYHGGTVDGNSGEGRNAAVALTATETGTYYIAATGSGASTGTYRLSVAEYSDDHPDNWSTTGTVAVDGLAHGEIEEPGDEDWFAVELSAGVSYRVDLEGQSTDAGTLSDPFIAGVHGPSGYHGGTVDGNSGEGRNAAVALTPTEQGTYYIAATGSGASTGTYRLSVTEYEDDRPDQPEK